MTDLAVSLGPVSLRSPLIAASGTVGSVIDFEGVAGVAAYGAMVAKSVAGDPWTGNRTPRMAPVGSGMLNSIGMQNPGIDAWVAAIGSRIGDVDVPVWGSAVGRTFEEFGHVAKELAATGVPAMEVNLSCPNLDGEGLIALDAEATNTVIREVRAAVDIPVAAKLSPNAQNIGEIAAAARDGGADWVVLTNTLWGSAIDIETRRSRLSAYQGGYSGPPLKPIALRCVAQVAREIPELPIVGCGGVVNGRDVVEFMMAGASAVALGSVHFAEPRAATRISRELVKWCSSHGVERVRELTGAVSPW